jgi:hypothetical protein
MSVFWKKLLAIHNISILEETVGNSSSQYSGRNCWNFIMSVFWKKLLAIHNVSILEETVGNS